jgi:hypothetical protein
MEGRAKVQWRQFLIALAVSFGVAVLVNWAILRLFGQKSADRAEHSLVGIILLMAYVSRFVAQSETRIGAVAFFLLALVPCYLGTVFPDLDIALLGIGAHRNPLFHGSLSFFVLLLLVNRQGVVLQALSSATAWGSPATCCGTWCTDALDSETTGMRASIRKGDPRRNVARIARAPNAHCFSSKENVWRACRTR